MKKYFILFTFAFLTLLFTSCQQDPPVQTTLGAVVGNVVSPNGTPIATASVKVLNTVEVYETKTNQSGEFSFMIPVGDQVLEITTGDGFIFKSEVPVNVTENEETSVNEVDLRQVGAIAYIPGSFDEIEHIIVDVLGYEADEVTQTDVTGETFIYDYSGLFLNCSFDQITAEVSQGVSNFINNGGSVYASDFASHYFLGNIYTGSCPNNRDGAGFMEGDVLCTSKIGITETLQANITDSDIATFAGVTSLEIEYDLPAWEHIENFSADFWDLVVTSDQGAPLMIKRSAPEDPSDDKPFGNIYYTTFHNHPGGTVSPEIEKILEYVVLNL